MTLRVLFIGGNGVISSAASRLAVAQGHDLTLINRGHSTLRPPIEGARTINGDATDPASIAAAVGNGDWDVVVNFRSFTPAEVRFDVELFAGRVGQYVYISSAAAYRKPLARIPAVESSPLANPAWSYAQGKADSEAVLMGQDRLPVTIVRPSHTYDATLIPMDGGWTVIDRMRRGRSTIVHGDGTSLWALTHQRDLAVGLNGLFGNDRALGEVFHITSDEILTWDQIARTLAEAAGVEASIHHVTSDRIAREMPEWRAGLQGDKAHSVVFDNTKIKSVVPEFKAVTSFRVGASEIIEWYDANADRRVVDPRVDLALERLAQS